MTEMLDPHEITAQDHVLSVDCWCEPEVIKPDEEDDFLSGAVCNIDAIEECEVCQ